MIKYMTDFKELENPENYTEKALKLVILKHLTLEQKARESRYIRQ